ncbi:MAG: hypothetical protein QXG00_03215 [Candidatus Woesearchaeota archaeon]
MEDFKLIDKTDDKALIDAVKTLSKYFDETELTKTARSSGVLESIKEKFQKK